MLQQTRIEAVIPYYERFLAELPDVQALADVPEDRLLKLWEGLGYYSRARNLKKAAGIVMEKYSGQLPDTAEQLEKLPGIGAYTAGSIASIAFGRPSPAVDGNVMRVMMRLQGRTDDPADPKNRRRVTAELAEVYPEGEESALLTEGLMELGERICIPNGAPFCSVCPLENFCEAHRQGRETELPTKTEKKARRIEQKTVLLLQCGGYTALQKRPERGLLAGLWGFPVLDGYFPAEDIKNALNGRNLDVADIVPCGAAKHIFTHIEWHMEGYRVTCRNMPEDYIWVTKEDLERSYSVPTAFAHYRKQL